MNRIQLTCFISLTLLSSCKKAAPAPAPPPVERPDASVSRPWALTPVMLDGFLRYQRTLLTSVDAGGVEQKAERDEKAREEAGLALDDVMKIEAMVARVAADTLAREAGAAASPPFPSALEVRPAVKKTVRLTEERAEFGSDNIDVLLQRESEVVGNWARMMEL